MNTVETQSQCTGLPIIYLFIFGLTKLTSDIATLNSIGIWGSTVSAVIMSSMLRGVPAVIAVISSCMVVSTLHSCDAADGARSQDAEPVLVGQLVTQLLIYCDFGWGDCNLIASSMWCFFNEVGKGWGYDEYAS